MRSPVKFAKELVTNFTASRELGEINRNPASSPYVVQVLDAAQTQAVRRRLVDLYLENGTISADDVDWDTGTLKDDKDPQSKHAIFFGVKRRNPDGSISSDIIESAKLILENVVDGERQGMQSFQPHFQELPLGWQRYFAEVDPGTVAEFASFIKEPDLDDHESKVARAHLIREIIGTARQLGVQELIFGMSQRMVDSYRDVFGSAIQPMKHKPITFGEFGAQKVPCVLDIETGYQTFQNEKRRKLGMGALVAFMGKAFGPIAEVRDMAPINNWQLPARLRGRVAIGRRPVLPV